MTNGSYCSFPPEISQAVLSSLTGSQAPSSMRCRQLEKDVLGDDEDATFVIDPSPPRWPRIFPSL